MRALASLLLIASPAAATEAVGSFTVALTPLPPAPGGAAQYRLEKAFSGDLTGSGSGVMLSAGDPASGSAGYVAIETVTGQLAGRSGSFALQHSGVMGGGTQSLTITIVPGSGTGDLAGISGSMTIRNSGGQHGYALSYTIPQP